MGELDVVMENADETKQDEALEAKTKSTEISASVAAWLHGSNNVVIQEDDLQFDLNIWVCNLKESFAYS